MNPAITLDREIVPLVAEMTAWRRRFHQHPELGFEEVETSAFVAERLRGWGIETHVGLGGTGVVGVIYGDGGPGPAIGLRADMDALPIEEQGQAPYRSERPGLMHACGHDGHTAMLLGAACVLAKQRDFAGTVNLIFQPAEEGLGGARTMIADGLFERFPCDTVFALHNAPPLRLGTAAVHSGPACAGAARFVIAVRGHGGHAATPYLTASPVSAAAALVALIEAIPARRIPASGMAVMTVGSINGGDAFNVVPDSVTLTGTARAFAPATMQALEAELRRCCTGIEAAHGVACDVRFELLFPPTVNDAREAGAAAGALEAILGADAVTRDMPPVTGSEDFAYMLERLPGAYVLLGTRVADDTPMLHSPDYDFEDRLLPIGASFFLKMVELKLGAGCSAA
ncbi:MULTISPECIES: amidohydrolase [unclassified Sphingomonas]|jgi:amidohydrolase|nr:MULTISPECIES: amidohydrolase [unclassified Sphingomonas]